MFYHILYILRGMLLFRGCVLLITELSMAKIRPSLQKKCHPKQRPPYTITGPFFNNKDIRDKYVLALRKQISMHYRRQKYIPRMTNENFINAPSRSIKQKYIPNKNLETKSRVPWETLVVREKTCWT